MSLPKTQSNGFVTPGIHRATLNDINGAFGKHTPRREHLMSRLRELMDRVTSTGRVKQAFVFGSFVTSKPFPRDLDVMLLMREGFDREFTSLAEPERSVFEHERARLLFEADVFWATEAIGAEEFTSWLSVYQHNRDMVECGIVEVVLDD